MGIIVPFATLISFTIALGYGAETNGFGYLLGIVLPLLVLLYAFGLGIGLEDKIDSFMSGGKKKK